MTSYEINPLMLLDDIYVFCYCLIVPTLFMWIALRWNLYLHFQVNLVGHFRLI